MHTLYIKDGSRCAVIVAHPDDETLWAGGLMLMHPDVKWTVVTLCRKSDAERSAKFFGAMEEYDAAGFMADMDDGPEQKPLEVGEVQRTIAGILAPVRFDVVVTHSTSGEYTRHLRHEETAQAVMRLWKTERLSAGQIWCFAYEDGGGQYLPRAEKGADLQIRLPDSIWQRKYDIITKVYGFEDESFEAKTTPRHEAFWCFGSTGRK